MAIAHSACQRSESLSTRDTSPCVKYSKVNQVSECDNQRLVTCRRLESASHVSREESERIMRSIEAIIEEDDCPIRGQGHSRTQTEIPKRGIYTLAEAVAKVRLGRFTTDSIVRIAPLFSSLYPLVPW